MNPKDIVIVAGARTPFGAFVGTLKDFSATDLGVIAAKEALKRSNLQPEQIDQVVFGNVLQTSPDAIYLSRHVALRSGCKEETPAVTVNRLCGSGLEAIIQGARLIQTGEANYVLAGGTESMSQAPHAIWGAREGLKFGRCKMVDVLYECLVDTYTGLPMAITAENLAQKYGIGREEIDRFALRSEKAAWEAIQAGRFKEEIVGVEIKDRKGNVKVIDTDEGPRPDTTYEALAKLKPAFRPDGFVTGGNASGINDGAGAVVLTTAERAADLGVQPLGRLVSHGTCGVDPKFMGIGPAPSSRIALDRAGLSLGDLDLIEVNEAFAAQYLAVEKELGLDRDKTNVNGGAVSLGHPLAASGARLAITVLYELRRRNQKLGLATLCIGGGQGIATVLEAL